MPTLASPATAKNNVHGILCKAFKVKNALREKSVAVVSDLAIHAKTVEIMWKHDVIFKSNLPQVGTSHTIMVPLSIIGKRFVDAGLQDTVIESSIIEGSVGKLFDESYYIMAVYFQKLMYESCMRILQDGSQEWVRKEHKEHVVYV